MFASFNRELLAWYDSHKRDLPWRRADLSPYHVWLSEVMLQQTVVKTVEPYYARFIKIWPSFAHVAAAPLDDILYQWQGLGYYRRAHNLHKCAQKVVNDYGGVLPERYEELLTLPGLGTYTAAAIAAIAFGEKVAVLDGNIVRVLSRVFCVEQTYPQSAPILRAHYLSLVDQRPGDFAQALMDVSQQFCRPHNPRCDECPVRSHCQAHQNGVVAMYPIKRAKKPAKSVEAMCWVVINADGHVLMRQRPPQGLLGGLYDVPTLPSWDGGSDVDCLEILHNSSGQFCGQVTHKFTHLSVQLNVYKMRMDRVDSADYGWFDPRTVPLSTMVRKVLKRVQASTTPEATL